MVKPNYQTAKAKTESEKVSYRIITSPQSNLRRACRKGPTGYNGTPQIHPQNCSFPFDDHHPNLIHPSLDQLATHHHKRHPDPIGHFATIHLADRPTDQQTDRQTDRQMVQVNVPHIQ